MVPSLSVLATSEVSGRATVQFKELFPESFPTLPVPLSVLTDIVTVPPTPLFRAISLQGA